MSELKKIPSKSDRKRYIDCLKTIYRIDYYSQPKFWDAVDRLICDQEADISDLIRFSETMDYCVIVNGKLHHVCVLFPEVNRIEDLAMKFAREIITMENTPVTPCDIFIINKKLDLMQKAIEFKVGKI